MCRHVYVAEIIAEAVFQQVFLSQVPATVQDMHEVGWDAVIVVFLCYLCDTTASASPAYTASMQLLSRT